jgi:hypothetical protein
MDDGLGSNNFVDLYGVTSDTLVTEYTTTNVVKGRTYAFRYRTRNIYGWSTGWSPVTYILAADTPSQPAKPTLTAASDVSISLQFSPCLDNGGSPIFKYRLYMNQGTDGSVFTEPVSYVTTSLALSHTLETGNEPLIATGKIYQIKFACENIKGIS